MPRLILAVVNPDNTPHGYNWTFAFPMLLFIVIGGVLYLLFSRPHRRVPARAIMLPARSSSVPPADAARSASVAGGLSTAPGGGTTESHLEPGGVHQAATGTGEIASTDERGSWQAGAQAHSATASGPEHETGDSGEAPDGTAETTKDTE